MAPAASGKDSRSSPPPFKMQCEAIVTRLRGEFCRINDARPIRGFLFSSEFFSVSSPRPLGSGFLSADAFPAKSPRLLASARDLIRSDIPTPAKSYKRVAGSLGRDRSAFFALSKLLPIVSTKQSIRYCSVMNRTDAHAHLSAAFACCAPLNSMGHCQPAIKLSKSQTRFE